MTRGRPLRFLGAVVTGWVLLRLAMIEPPTTMRRLANVPVRFARLAAKVVVDAPPSVSRPPANPLPIDPNRRRSRLALPLAIKPDVSTLAAKVATSTSDRTMAVIDTTPAILPTAAALSPAVSVRADTADARRWSASFWLIVRDGRGIGAGLAQSQLGGSQTGGRIAYALGHRRVVSVIGRLASPLAGAGQEAALGLEWTPSKLPVRLFVEQRIGINGIGSGPAFGVIGGIGPVPVGAGFKLESYGQAGVIRRNGVIGYADGSVRVNRQIAMIGDTQVDLGAGGWGGVQPGARRLDVGPSLALGVPLGDRRVRIALDWRERLAGNARPGSGPTLSIGADF